MSGDREALLLAADIRAVDGNHDLGAGELAARLVERGWVAATEAGSGDREALREALEALVSEVANVLLVVPMRMKEDPLASLSDRLDEYERVLATTEAEGIDVETLAPRRWSPSGRRGMR